MNNVDEALDREILRRINNRYYENKDVCSLRSMGPGLVELAGLIPLLNPLPADAVVHYAHELAAIKPVLRGCVKCEGKLHAILYLILRWADPETSLTHLLEMCRCIATMQKRGGRGRDFLVEVLNVMRQTTGWHDPLIVTEATRQ